MMTVTGLNETLQMIPNAAGGSEDIRSKIDDVLERLARLGVEVAWTHYTSGDLDGNYDFDVDWQFNGENSVCVIAKGTQVLFLEFGTGAKYAGTNPYGTDMGFNPIFRPGDYSKQHKNQWDNPKGWYYYSGQKAPTHGIPATRGMYEAKKEMLNEIDSIVREVFGND